MANPYEQRVGRTRRRLAAMLSETFTHAEFRPEDCASNAPVFARRQYDCCSWTAWGRLKSNPKIHVHVCSWDTMGEIVRNGFDWSSESPFVRVGHDPNAREFEISARTPGVDYHPLTASDDCE